MPTRSKRDAGHGLFHIPPMRGRTLHGDHPLAAKGKTGFSDDEKIIVLEGSDMRLTECICGSYSETNEGLFGLEVRCKDEDCINHKWMLHRTWDTYIGNAVARIEELEAEVVKAELKAEDLISEHSQELDEKDDELSDVKDERHMYRMDVQRLEQMNQDLIDEIVTLRIERDDALAKIPKNCGQCGLQKESRRGK